MLKTARLLGTSIRMSLGQIWANKMRSLLATLGIVIGIASVLAVIASLTGLKSKVLSEFESLGARKIYVYPDRPKTGPDKDASWRRIRFRPEQFDGLLAQTQSISSFTRIFRSWADVSYGTTTIDPEVKGIDFAWHAIEQRGVTRGRPFGITDQINARPVCLITQITVEELGLPAEPIGVELTLLNRRFTVIGIVEPDPAGGGVMNALEGNDEEASRAEVFVPFDTLSNAGRGWMFATLYAKSPTLVDEAEQEARFFFRKTRGVSPGDPDNFRFELLTKSIEQFTSIAGSVTAIAAGIVSISLLVGGVGIMNIMLVSVSERTREIGLRKAVGAKPAALLLQFLIESATLCTLGGALGLLGAQALVEALRRFPDANLDQTVIPIWAIALALVFSGTVGIAFGFFPALKAARMDPITALRHE
jgi:putative ABC transport system permease protein